MTGFYGLGGWGYFFGQILFHRKSKFRQVLTYIYINIMFAA